MTMSLEEIMQSTDASSEIPGVLVDGTFWYWDGVITADAIAYRKRSLRIAKFLRNVGIGFGIVGIIGFIAGIVLSHATDVLDIDFWSTPHLDLFSLWIGVLGFCFGFYKSRWLASIS